MNPVSRGRMPMAPPISGSRIVCGWHTRVAQVQRSSTSVRPEASVSRPHSSLTDITPARVLRFQHLIFLGVPAATLLVCGAALITVSHPSSALASSASSSSPPTRESLVVQGYVHVPPQYLPDLRLTLNGGQLSVAPSAAGAFEIGPLRPGSYLLQPSHPLLHLASYLIRVPTSSSDALQVFALGDSFRPVVRLQLPLVIAPVSPAPPLYFAIKPPFSLLVLLQQPLLLVAIACCALMWCLPRLQQYQEEDERQQRAAMLQQEELLVRRNASRDHAGSSQERYAEGGRATPPVPSWRSDERGGYRIEPDRGRVEGEDEQSDDVRPGARRKEKLCDRRAFPPGAACVGRACDLLRKRDALQDVIRKRRIQGLHYIILFSKCCICPADSKSFDRARKSSYRCAAGPECFSRRRLLEPVFFVRCFFNDTCCAENPRVLLAAQRSCPVTTYAAPKVVMFTYQI